MANSWTEPRNSQFRDAYLDWSHMLQSRRDALDPPRPDVGVLFEPIFVRLEPAQDMQVQRRALRDMIAPDTAPFLIDGHELDWLSSRIGDVDPYTGMADEYALYRRLGTPDRETDHVFKVLDTGSPVRINMQAGTQPAPAAFTVAPSPRTGAPIVAIIDDGLGFLNTRFQRHDGGQKMSRFHALWLQAQEQYLAEPRRMVSGQMLDRDEIDGLIARNAEVDTYDAVNAALFQNTLRWPSAASTTHGTHMLDLAAGADPDDTNDPVRDWPLLGVQLPPQAVEDTSGTRFENYMLQAVRWILRQAEKLDASAPVIINISMGIVAGPKDGSRFLEYQLAREVAGWEGVTGQPVRLVWAFGNNRRSNLVARFSYDQNAQRSATDQTVTWRVQPGDQTASYLELHGRGVDHAQVQVSVTSPLGVSSGFVDMTAGQIRSLETQGVPVARMYHVKARDFGAGTICQGHYVIALAPSEGRRAGEPECASGSWQVAIRYTGASAADFHLQIQRDDQLHAAAAQARQSYFDHPDAYEWDGETQSHSALSPTCPINTQGSHNALVTPSARQVFCVGAAASSPFVASMQGSNYVPARYTAEGADWSVDGPTASMVAERGTFLPGILGAGTLSGATRALNGTSAAAARLTRMLGHSAAKIAQNAASATQTDKIDDFDTDKVDLVATDPGTQARLGAHLVEPSTGDALR